MTGQRIQRKRGAASPRVPCAGPAPLHRRLRRLRGRNQQAVHRRDAPRPDDQVGAVATRRVRSTCATTRRKHSSSSHRQPGTGMSRRPGGPTSRHPRDALPARRAGGASVGHPAHPTAASLEKTFVAAHFRQVVDQQEIQHTQARELAEHDRACPERTMRATLASTDSGCRGAMHGDRALGRDRNRRRMPVDSHRTTTDARVKLKRRDSSL